jgi:flagellar hook assembly protein FlgD
VYDVSGKLVRELVDEVQPPGGYSVKWNGRNDGGSMVGSGVYFCRMTAGEFSRSIKIVLVK